MAKHWIYYKDHARVLFFPLPSNLLKTAVLQRGHAILGYGYPSDKKYLRRDFTLGF